NEIGGQIAAVQDLESVLGRAAYLVQQSFGYHHVALFTLDRQHDELVMRAKAGAFTELFPPGHRLKLGQGIVGWVCLHGEKLLANDVDIEPRYVNLCPDILPTKSELCVPIQIGQEVVGAIDVQSPEPNAFDENDVMLIDTLAGQLAVAIDNARLYEALQQELTERRQAEEIAQRRADQAALIYEVGHRVSGELELKALLSEVVSAVRDTFGYDVLVMLLDEKTDRLVLQAIAGSYAHLFPEGLWLEVGEGMVGQAAATGETQLSGDVSQNSHYVRKVQEETRSELSVPIKSGPKVIGVLDLQSDDLNAFDENDAMVLETLADQIAMAINNAELFESAQQRVVELETLRRTSLQLTSSMDLSTILDAIVESALKLVQANNCHIYLYDEASEAFTFGAALWSDGRREAAVKALRRDGFTATVARQGSPVIINDAAHHPLYSSPEAQEWNMQAIAGFPLKLAERVLGVFTISFTKPYAFDEEGLRLLGLLADQAAIAIENAQLVSDLEEKVKARTVEIRAEKEKSDAILRSAADAIGMTDLEMRVQYVNKAFTALTGYTMTEVIGRRGTFLLAKRMPARDWQSLQEAMAQGETWQGEVTLQRKDGRTYDAALTIAPMRDTQGKVVGYVASHRDISRFKDLERARKQFMTNVSHELRTPAANIKLYAKLLQMRNKPEKAEHYAQVLEGQAERLAELIDDILQITELDSGQMITDWKQISLSTLLRDSITRYQSRAGAADITLKAMPLPVDLPVVKGDQIRLSQALGELVENAIIFTPAGGQVTLEAGMAEEEEQQWVTIDVRDTGPGISQEEQERIFDRFFRGRLAESGQVPGTGLGLSIAQEIARAHGGRLTVDSELDEGSVFTLWLRVVPI
ncbi:MAG: hypothetical protein B6I35_10540, partial [Anaerolineaceae bacterium 4572_32.2]